MSEQLRAIRTAFAKERASGAAALPELPFCLASANGSAYDAMAQLRGTLAGLLTILLLVIGGIVAIFTRGTALWIVLGIAAVAALFWLWHRLTLARLGGAWRKEAEPFAAAVIMANNSVLQPGNSVVPGAMIVDFSDSLDAQQLAQAGERFFGLVDQESVPPHHQELVEWLQTEMERARYGRIRLPKDIAGGDDCWAVSLRFDRAMMPQGYVDRSNWIVLARKGRPESAEIMPHRYWAGRSEAAG